jgi:segregation and condensation protein B
MPDPAPANRNPEEGPQALGLESFRQPPQEDGLSLDKLNRAFAAMLQTGDDPYSVPADPDEDPISAALVADDSADAEEDPKSLPGSRPAHDEFCEINPRSILEAMLFVGTPDNQPLTAQQIAGLMRGVRPAEIDELVRELNLAYAAANRPYHIAGQGNGYRMTLWDEFGPVRDKFHGRIKQARLSPAAVEVLALVAYNEPLTAEEVNRLRGTPSGSVLTHLVRRQLLRVDRGEVEPRVARYCTTDRFLKLFRMQSLTDLPQSLEIDRQ